MTPRLDTGVDTLPRARPYAGSAGNSGAYELTSARRQRGGDARRGVRRTRRLVLAVLVLALAAAVVGMFVAWRDDRLPPQVAARLYPLGYAQEIAQVARLHGVDPYLVAAVVQTESGFDPSAESAAGAVGLMQLMPATAHWIVSRDDWSGPSKPDLRDPVHNLQLGSYYLAHLLERFNGHEPSALAAYNAGWGRVGQWLAEEGSGSQTLTVESIPYQETRDFVQRVERFRSIYLQAYPDAFE